MVVGLSYYGAASFAVTEMMILSSPNLFQPFQLHHAVAVAMFITARSVTKWVVGSDR